MTNVFKDQETFMIASGQTVDVFDQRQFNLYLKLMEEEWNELKVAIDDNNNVEAFDALLDLMVVTIGAIQSAGFDGEGGWQEVMRSNLSKIDQTTGKVRKREDGKILKPENWTPPNLKPFLQRSKS
jgi:predicted HAD superfamily Cof-like phosphohydrolase